MCHYFYSTRPIRQIEASNRVFRYSMIATHDRQRDTLQRSLDSIERPRETDGQPFAAGPASTFHLPADHSTESRAGVCDAMERVDGTERKERGRERLGKGMCCRTYLLQTGGSALVRHALMTDAQLAGRGRHQRGCSRRSAAFIGVDHGHVLVGDFEILVGSAKTASMRTRWIEGLASKGGRQGQRTGRTSAAPAQRPCTTLCKRDDGGGGSLTKGHIIASSQVGRTASSIGHVVGGLGISGLPEA